MSTLNNLENLFIQKYAFLQTLSEQERIYIHRQVRISMIGATTRIENAVLTDSEINWIDTVLAEDGKLSAFSTEKAFIENKLSKDKERSIEEVAGCRDMLMLIYSQHNNMHPLTESDLRGLHYQLMQYYPKAKSYLGKYKNMPNSVVETNHSTGLTREVFTTAPAGPITNAAMSDLIQWYQDAPQKNNSDISICCDFVYRFLAIHPFQDGNGRMGRGLFLLGLLNSRHEAIRTVAPYIAFDREIEITRPEYYFVLNRCSNGKFKANPEDYHTEFFLDYMIKILTRSLEHVNYYHDRYQKIQNLSEATVAVLDCFKEYPEVKLTTLDICQKTNLARRTVNNALNTLLKDNFIQRFGQGAGTRYQLFF